MVNNEQESHGSIAIRSNAGRHCEEHYPPRNPHVSLKQWRFMQAVVDCGGFSQASASLHLSQSAISAAISKMQEQLGVTLFKIEGRKAKLTKAGRAILVQSRLLINKANNIEELARSLGRGWDPEIRLGCDPDFPTELLLMSLNEFRTSAKCTKILLNETSNSEVMDPLIKGYFDLAISRGLPAGFIGIPLVEIEYIAVAHALHPLFRIGREITLSDLSDTVQIIIGKSDDYGEVGMLSPAADGHYWHVSNLDTALAAVREGIGFSWLPRYRIAGALSSGELVALPFRDGHLKIECFYLIRTPSVLQGPSIQHLIDTFVSFSAQSEFRCPSLQR